MCWGEGPPKSSRSKFLLFTLFMSFMRPLSLWMTEDCLYPPHPRPAPSGPAEQLGCAGCWVCRGGRRPCLPGSPGTSRSGGLSTEGLCEVQTALCSGRALPSPGRACRPVLGMLPALDCKLVHVLPASQGPAQVLCPQ